jgi:surface polysaccharide O-acyltransferase-like enzyme
LKNQINYKLNCIPLKTSDQTQSLKGLAIGAVVLIHTVNMLIGHALPNSQFWNVLVVFDQILRFCVPLFVALSGYALASKYQSKNINPTVTISLRL